MKQVDELYFYYNEDYKLEKVLVENKDGTGSFFTLPDNYRKLSASKRQKVDKKINQKSIQLLNHLNKNSNCTTIRPQDKELISYLEERIDQLDRDRYYNREKKNIMLAGLFTILIPLLVKNKMISYLLRCFPIYSSISALGDHHNYQFNDKNQSSTVKNLKLYISSILLATNLGVNILTLSCDSLGLSQDFQYILEEISNNPTEEENDFFLPIYVDTLPLEEKIGFWKTSIEYNHSLKELEKEIAYFLEGYMKANPYIDYYDVCARFFTVSIKNTLFWNGRTLASYDREMNRITNYNSMKKELECYKMNMFHEFVHMTGSLDNVLLNEGITSLICHEFYPGVFEDGYNRNVVMCKIFCELIGANTMLKAYSNQDISIIENALYEIIPDQEFNQKFLCLLDDYAKYRRKDKIEESVLQEKVDEIVYYLQNYLDSSMVSEEKKKIITDSYIVPFIVEGLDGTSNLYFHSSENNYQKVRSW